MQGSLPIVSEDYDPEIEAAFINTIRELRRRADHAELEYAGTHEADLDGNCENCGLLIGFHGTHEMGDCVRELKACVVGLRDRVVELGADLVTAKARIEELEARIETEFWERDSGS